MNVVIKNFQKRMLIQPAWIKRIARRVLGEEKVFADGEITFCFVNAGDIREVNLNYLGRNLTTDVIAFDLTCPKEKGASGIIADIVISSDAAFSNARIFKTTPRRELALYVIHGLLHILGYRDGNKDERTLMQKKEGELLSQCLSRKAKQ